MGALLALLIGTAKLGKAGGTLITMLLSLAAYAAVFGWPYATGFILMLLLHELGHYVAARQKGLSVGAPTFIPFVGAWIELKEQPLDVKTEAYVAAAGPLVGTIAATLCYALARQTSSQMLMAVAYAGMFINLFNLLPVPPLDGGRVTGALSPRIWLIGVPIIVAMTVYRFSPIMVMILIMAAPAALKAWRFDPTAEENKRYYDIAAGERLEYALLYFGMLAYLGYMTEALHEMVGAR